MPMVRVVLANAAHQNWEIEHKSAYLNAKLKETIHMKPLRGVLKKGQEGKVLRLKKGLYGLKQAGRGWYLLRTFTFYFCFFTYMRRTYVIHFHQYIFSCNMHWRSYFHFRFFFFSSLHAFTLKHGHAFIFPFTWGLTLYKRVVYSRILQLVLYWISIYLVSTRTLARLLGDLTSTLGDQTSKVSNSSKPL